MDECCQILNNMDTKNRRNSYSSHKERSVFSISWASPPPAKIIIQSPLPQFSLGICKILCGLVGGATNAQGTVYHIAQKSVELVQHKIYSVKSSDFHFYMLMRTFA